ncbi:hypothetical protein AC578_9129 [Pseudocercospora eumusae]|uniref:Uncharacterized protein n=1 Tax=Pseudocercospora eumusae TaxID=321146 RepID=A0A139HV47_9PEZI|nr:hypothetical protein AC578_9129 [Pseudocercospora eumusae]
MDCRNDSKLNVSNFHERDIVTTDASQTTHLFQVVSHPAAPLFSSASHSVSEVSTSEPRIGERRPESRLVRKEHHNKIASRFLLSALGWLKSVANWVRDRFSADAHIIAMDRLSDENQRLRQALMNYENANRNFQQENLNLRRELDGRVQQQTRYLHEHYNDRLRQEREEQVAWTENRIAALESQHKTELARKNEAIRNRDAELEKLHHLAVRLEETVTARDAKIIQHETRLQSQDEAIRNLQASAMRSLEVAHWAPDSVENIQRQMKDLMLDIEDWAENFSLLPLEMLLEPERLGWIGLHLKRSGCVGSLEDLKEAIVADEDTRQPGRASALMLSAIVSFEVFRRVFCNPFFAFAGNYDQREVLRHADGDAARSICELIRRGSPEDAEGLRCQILRLLDPPGHRPNRGVDRLKDMAKASRDHSVGLLAGQMSRSIAEHLVHPELLADAEDALMMLMRDAAKLSWSLLTRKSRIDMADGFLVTEEDKIFYHADSSNLEAHSQHRKALQEDRNAMNGRKVFMLTRPAVMLAGDADGQNYNQKRVLMKAVGWMG